MIAFDNVYKRYKKDTEVFADLSMSILPGEFVVITGAPGSGKTTFLKMILNEEKPSEGAVLFEGDDLSRLSSSKIKNYRRSLGTIFQDFKLLPHKTVYENVAFALEVLGFDDEEIARDAQEVLDIVGMSHRKQHFPKELSGGEKQKVSIARALISRPKVILADEPTGSLDENGAKEIAQVLKAIHEKQKVSIARALISRPKVILADEPTGSLDENGAKEIAQALKAIHALGTTIIIATHNDKIFAGVKNIRKISIKDGGVVAEVLKNIVYSNFIETDMPEKKEYNTEEN